MNNEVEFRTVEELYSRIKPALYSKMCELKRLGIDYVKEEDLWNFLVENSWKNKNGLSLYDMTNDIFDTDADLIDAYIKEKIKTNKRKINTETGDLL